MLKKPFNGIWDEYSSLVQQIDTVFHLCRVATPTSSVKLPFQYLSPLYAWYAYRKCNKFLCIEKKALQSFTCVHSYSSCPPGTDLGYVSSQGLNQLRSPSWPLYCRGRDQSGAVVRSFFQSDCIAFCYRDNFEILIICCK